MTETLEMLPQATSKDLTNVTFSQALGDGLTHSGWLVYRMTTLSGQEAVLASHSVAPDRAKEQQTKDTCGPLFGGLSPSAGLQSSLENRLRQLMDVNGSPEYDLTWKRWNIGLGPQICALRASARQTSDSVCGGWPTTSARDWKDTPGMSETGTNPDGSERTRLDQLPRVAALTTRKQSGGRAEMENGEGCRAGWPTVLAIDASKAGKVSPRPGAMRLSETSPLAGYPTPRTPTGGPESAERKKELGREKSGGGDLQAVAETYRLPNMDGWMLNHRFSLWLQAYPAEWACCGERAMQSILKLRKSL
jgi:hypothetical protein